MQARCSAPTQPCSTHGGCAAEQQLGSRSLVFKSIKGDCYGDTTAASANGSARHPIWPSPPMHLLSSRPSKFGVCLEFMDTLTVFSTPAYKRWVALESFTVPQEVQQHHSAHSCRHAALPGQHAHLNQRSESAKQVSTGLSPASKWESS